MMRAVRSLTSLVLLLPLSILLPACTGAEDGPPQVAEEDIPPAARDSLTMEDLGGLEVSQIQLTIPWTNGSIDRPGQEGAGRSSITRFELTEQDGFDRLFLEFSDDGEFPGYLVEYANATPTLCTSGARTLAEGRAHVRVLVGPLRVRDTDGSATFDAQQQTPLPFENVSGVEVVCLENNRLDWVLGVLQRQPFRVLELRGPRRLIVDVAHPPF